MIVEAEFGSSWDNHEDVISSCKVDLETGHVFDIAETDIAPTGTLDYVFVRYDDAEVVNVELDHEEYFGDCDQYYLESKLDEAKAAENDPARIAQLAEEVDKNRQE